MVQSRLDALLGDEVLEVEARAQVRVHRGRWTAELTVDWQGHANQRRLDADDCTSLADAIALWVAVMADPLRTTRRVDETRTIRTLAARGSEDPSTLPTEPRRVMSSSPSVEPHRVAPPHVPEPDRTPVFGLAGETRGAPVSSEPERGPALVLAMLVDGGTLPRVTPAPVVGFVWRGPRVRLLAEVLVLPPRRVRSSASYAQGRVLMGAGRMGVCARLVVSPRVRLPLCGAVEIGGATASGFGQTQQRGATNLWFAGITRGSLIVDVGRRLSLVAGLEMAAAGRRIEYRHQGEWLHGTAPVALRGRAGVEFRWGAQRSTEPENR